MVAQCNEKHIFNFPNTDELIHFLTEEWGYSFREALCLLDEKYSEDEHSDKRESRIEKLILRQEKKERHYEWTLINENYITTFRN